MLGKRADFVVAGAQQHATSEIVHGSQVLGPICLRYVVEHGPQQRVVVHTGVKGINQPDDIDFGEQVGEGRKGGMGSGFAAASQEHEHYGHHNQGRPTQHLGIETFAGEGPAQEYGHHRIHKGIGADQGRLNYAQ